MLQTLTVADVMHRYPKATGEVNRSRPRRRRRAAPKSARIPSPRSSVPWPTSAQPQALFADETLEQALRQLTLYGHSGLPVVSHDGERLLGWITRQNVLGAIARRLDSHPTRPSKRRW